MNVHGAFESGARRSVADCVCDVEYYYDNLLEDEMDGDRECHQCPIGANCTTKGTTLEHMPILPGYWRWRKDVDEVGCGCGCG